MGEFIQQFGIDWKLLLSQVVNFLIVLIVLTKFAYKPILKMLGERTEKIERALNDATQAETLRQTMEVERNKVLAEAKKQAQGILQDAQAQIETNRQAQLTKTKEEVAQLVVKAKADIAAEQAKAVGEARAELGHLAVTLAEKVIQREVKEADHAKLIEDTLNNLKRA